LPSQQTLHFYNLIVLWLIVTVVPMFGYSKSFTYYKYRLLIVNLLRRSISLAFPPPFFQLLSATLHILLYSSYCNYYLCVVKSILGFDNTTGECNRCCSVCPSVLRHYRGHGYLQAAAAISMFILYTYNGNYIILWCVYEWAVTVVMATDS